MCAAVALRAFSDFQQASAAFVKLGPTIAPQSQDQELYAKTYERFVRLFTLLSQQRAFIP